VLIVIFGIFITGIFRIPFLDMEKKIHLRDKPAGYFGSSIVGITFAAGWTPCIGPIIASILGLAVIGSSENPLYGTLLLLVFSLGLAVPFLISSFLFNWFLSMFGRFKRFIPIVNMVSGIALIALGIFLFFTDFDTILMYIG
jgi:cytochrome c-type biogenesis protein